MANVYGCSTSTCVQINVPVKFKVIMAATRPTRAFNNEIRIHVTINVHAGSTAGNKCFVPTALRFRD